MEFWSEIIVALVLMSSALHCAGVGCRLAIRPRAVRPVGMESDNACSRAASRDVRLACPGTLLSDNPLTVTPRAAVDVPRGVSW